MDLFHIMLPFQRLLGETRRNVAQQIKERELEVQQLKQSLRSFTVSREFTVRHDASKHTGTFYRECFIPSEAAQ